MDPFYGKTGQPTAWIQWGPRAIYDRDGNFIGWVYGDGNFDLKGLQVGLNRGDHVLDLHGAIVGVMAGARLPGLQLPQPGRPHPPPVARLPPPAPAFRRKANRPWPMPMWSKVGVLESIGHRTVRPAARDGLGRLRRWLGDLGRKIFLRWPLARKLANCLQSSWECWTYVCWRQESERTSQRAFNTRPHSPVSSSTSRNRSCILALAPSL
jgi:hypothetical protein